MEDIENGKLASGNASDVGRDEKEKEKEPPKERVGFSSPKRISGVRKWIFAQKCGPSAPQSSPSRSQVHRISTLLLFTTTLAFIGLFIRCNFFTHVKANKCSPSSASTASHPSSSPSSSQGEADCGPSVCLTEACVKASADLLQNIDPSADPCEDFYQFSCGHWDRHHVLPSDRSHYDTFSLMKDELKNTLRDLLQTPIDERDSNATRNAKNLFASCMNETIIEKKGGAPLALLLDSFGGWPVIRGNWTEEEALLDWVTIMAKLRQFNNDILVGEWVGPDSKNSSVYVLQLDQPELGMPSREYYEAQTPQLEAYLFFMVEVAQLLGADPEIAERDMAEVLKLEVQLANITIPSEERRNYTAIYNKMTMDQLQVEIPLIDWKHYFDIIVPIKINGSEEIVVYALSYFQKMVNIVEITPKRTVINYLLWRFVYNRVSNLDRRFLEKQQEYYKSLYGTQSTPDRWKTCTMYVNKNMGMAVGALFVRSHFNENSKQRAEEMISDIKESFFQILRDVDWMDEDTKRVAKRKADLMSEKIGYPSYIVDPQELDKDYEGIEFEPDSYFENVINTLKHIAFKEQMKLRLPVDKTQWVTSPAVVNAFYTRSKNFITFPAGILQPPVYHPDYPTSLNYGGIGVVIGHEVTHGFDDKGRQFDPYGNLKQWWGPLSLKKFYSKAQCMVKQYNSYVMPDIGLKVNGINTQGENIADNGGIKQAFRAYQRWEARHGSEPLLPGLNLTHHQLFFLNYAQIWCGTMRPEAAVNAIRTGAHSPGRFRIIGALSNSNEFAKAYNCPAESVMNPRHKCEVW